MAQPLARRLVELVSAAIAIGAALPAVAQPVSISTTFRADDRTLPTFRLISALNNLATEQQWPNVRQDTCADADTRLGSTEPVVVLLSSECLASMNVKPTWSLSANAGVAAHFFARRDHAALLNAETDVIGILVDHTKSKAFPAFAQFLADIGFGQKQLVQFNDYRRLVTALRPTESKVSTITAIVLLDDGPGVWRKPLREVVLNDPDPKLTALNLKSITVSADSIASREQTARDHKEQGKAVAPLGWLPYSVIESGWRAAGTDKDIDQFVKGITTPQPLLTFYFRSAEKLNGEGELHPADHIARGLSWGISFFVATVSAQEPERKRKDGPMNGVAPILVANEAANTRLSDILPVVRRAWLAAPIDALLTPCSDTQETLYGSFLHAALSTAASPYVMSAMWEHAAIVEGVTGRQEAGRRRGQIEALLGNETASGVGACTASDPEAKAQCRRNALVNDFIRDAGDGADKSCTPQRRMGFAVPAQAYYWQGIANLREALLAPVIDQKSPFFTKASDCLRQAFRAWGGKTPSCDKRSHGMWSDDYMPYLALAVIQSEKERK